MAKSKIPEGNSPESLSQDADQGGPTPLEQAVVENAPAPEPNPAPKQPEPPRPARLSSAQVAKAMGEAAFKLFEEHDQPPDWPVLREALIRAQNNIPLQWKKYCGGGDIIF